MDTNSVNDNHVLITGASNETGAFVAREFAEAGANLSLTYYSDEDKAEATRHEAEDHGASVETYQLDLLEQTSITNLIEQVETDWNRLDVLVLCAGSVGLRNFRELSRDELDTAIDGNLKGNLMLAKEFSYWMKETGGPGRIIQYTAQSADNTSHSAYGLAKAGQRESTSFLAWQLAPDVTVNTIQPISIDQDPDHDVGESYDAPMERKVHSKEIARMTRLICDPAFDTVTGETIRMDGGRHTQPAYQKDL